MTTRRQPIGVRPQWVMVGFPASPDLVPCEPGQVAILASTKLTAAELDYTARHYDFADWDDFRHRFAPHTTLAVEMEEYVIVVADTYAEALAELLQRWKPEAQEQPAIEGSHVVRHPARTARALPPP